MVSLFESVPHNNGDRRLSVLLFSSPGRKLAKMSNTHGDRPNIILINCDDLGYGDPGCYGSERNSTPNIDRLAGEGIRFTDFYVASPVCSASRASMLTGCYPRRIGMKGVLFPGDTAGLNTEEITIAGLLKAQGYATKLVGKWHCGDQPQFLPTRHGFDSYYGIPFSNDMGRQAGDGPKRPPLPLLRDETVIQQQPDQSSITERYVQESIEFIRSNRDRPFFLYLAHMHVHLPHYPPEHFIRNSKNGRYGGAVECIDWSTGVLCHELEELGIGENTIVIFTSDNGSRVRGEGGSNDPLRGTKGTCWEGGMRVPCIMRWPARIAPKGTRSQMVNAMDFLPTLAAAAGAEVPEDRAIDGKDIGPVLFGNEPESPHDAFFYYRQNGNLEAVRAGKWKLFVCRDDEAVCELYNLDEDVSESTDVAGQHPDVVAELEGKIRSCRKDIGDSAREMEGANCRPSGLAEDARPLTEYDENHPYIIAEYDLPDRG